MKKLLTAAALTLSLAAYAQADTPMVGNDTDAYGCKPSTGASYSFLLKKCVQVFDVAQIKLNDPNNVRHSIRQQSASRTVWRRHRRKHHFE